MKVLYPGTFDPLTNGHLDLIRRASAICEQITVAILHNSQKQTFFDLQTRLHFIRQASQDLPNVQVLEFRGLVVQLAKDLGVHALVRGMRDIGDFRFEWETALINRSVGDIETIFLMTDPQYAFVNSSRIRELIQLGGDIRALVPPVVSDYVAQLPE